MNRQRSKAVSRAEAVFLIKTFYTKLLNILEVFNSCGVMPRNTTLNHYYTSLLILAENLLNTPALKDFKKIQPEIYDSLIGDMQSMDESWEIVKGNNYDFLGKLEKTYIALGSPSFEPTKETVSFLKSIDLATQAHIEYCDQLFPMGKKNNLPQIFFDKNTGFGFVNNRKFTCKEKNRLFKFVLRLYEDMGGTVPRSEVLRMLNRNPEEGQFETKINNSKINDVVKGIRKIIGVDTNTLINNTGHLTLVATKLDSPPN